MTESEIMSCSERETLNRRPHAILDLPSREKKAEKIYRLLGLNRSFKAGCRILEIGTGSGGIAHYFAVHQELQCQVYAVDVVDNRKLKEGFHFSLVEDVVLPFDDESFDIVITNHVIEHVGEYDKQFEHLCEVRRVLKPGGLGYLAVPNKWMVVEPHYQLPFLSWMPKNLSSIYVRMMKKGDRYDCTPLSLKALSKLFNKAGLYKEHLELQALKELRDIEGVSSRIMSLILALPELYFSKIRWFSPTLICRFYK